MGGDPHGTLFHNLISTIMSQTTKTPKAPKTAKSTVSPSVNPALQYFNFKKYERKVFEQIGTLRSNFGEDADVAFAPKNFNSDENIFLVIELPTGESSTLSCSQAVSDALRSKEITIGQACNLPIILRDVTQGPNAGQKRPMITFPAQESNRLQKQKIGDLADSNFDPSAVNKAFNAPAW